MDKSTQQDFRLLVVEDDRAIQIVIDVILRRHAIVAEFADDGDAALRKLRRGRYDALVLDLMIPGVNGFEVIRELKQRNPELLNRTIVVTSAAERTLQQFDDSRVVRRVIRKPFDLGQFTAEVLACGS